MAYKQIIIGETDPTYVEINEFTDNDSNVDIFQIFHKVELKNVGGIFSLIGKNNTNYVRDRANSKNRIGWRKNYKFAKSEEIIGMVNPFAC